MAVISRAAPAQRAVPGVPRHGRRTEAVLLVFALALAALALIAVNLGAGQAWPQHVAFFAAVLGLLFGLAHLALRRWAPAADPLLLPLVAALNGLGLALIYRLDLAYATRATAARRVVPHPVAPLQLAWTGIGVALFIAVLVVVREHRLLQRYAYSAALAGLVLLFAPALLPARFSEVNGAKLWIRVGGFSLQPSEIAKIALVIFFATTSPASATCSPSPRVGWPDWTFHAAATWDRSRWPGWPACWCWSRRRTWAPRCCSLASSW
ncbi:MAG: hypothetical protein NVSMB13_07110 [Mycobacteriales bacterium]